MAALFVFADGPYGSIAGVDVWDLERDARRYVGPHPVVAHPPCARWCALAQLNAARWGTPVGEDGGTFAAGLAAVRTFGGVLEHPAQSLAWSTYGLPRPTRGGWARAIDDVGWVTEISQVAYGHAARKRTWLYYVGRPPASLDWSEPPASGVIAGGYWWRSGRTSPGLKVQRRGASLTPELLAATLVELARMS